MTPQKITDIWFFTSNTLDEIAAWLGLCEVVHDHDNYWEWCIGSFDKTRLDVTRSHTVAAIKVPTRIFRVDGELLDDELKRRIVSRLRSRFAGSINCGRWRYINGNDFELELVQEC